MSGGADAEFRLSNARVLLDIVVGELGEDDSMNGGAKQRALVLVDLIDEQLRAVEAHLASASVVEVSR